MSDEIVVQPVQPYKLRPHQLKWLDTQIEIKSDSPTEISTAAELSKTNWYNWLEEPGFEDAYYAEYDRRARRWRPYLDAIGLKKARTDHNYWKDMQKIAGRNDQSQVNVQFNKFEVVNSDGKLIDIK